ncbi:hypothetical protein N7507_008559 [Penicillium longicatenatum]|nr:hypothetical protein N7507_008559 [Penicillium longicatenatum]
MATNKPGIPDTVDPLVIMVSVGVASESPGLTGHYAIWAYYLFDGPRPLTCTLEPIGLASGFQASCRGATGSTVTTFLPFVLSNQSNADVPRYVVRAAVNAEMNDIAAAEAAALDAAAAGTEAAQAPIPEITFAIKDAIQTALGIASVLASQATLKRELASDGASGS